MLANLVLQPSLIDTNTATSTLQQIEAIFTAVDHYNQNHDELKNCNAGFQKTQIDKYKTFTFYF